MNIVRIPEHHNSYAEVPFASAIDTSLPSPPEIFNIFLDEGVDWSEVFEGEKHNNFRQNTEESIEMWHQRLGLTVPEIGR